MVEVTIREATEADVDAITAIQNAFITTHAIEWTDTPHTAADRKLWLARQHEVELPVLVAIAPRRDEVGAPRILAADTLGVAVSQ
jgi:L-amino acid N-acyltransferase YncA